MTDIPRLCEILRQAHSKTIYAREGHAIDDERMKSVLMQAIQSHMFNPLGEFFAEVSENKGIVEGFLIGISVPVYLIGEKHQASDLFWISTDKVKPAEPLKLMKNMIAWAKQKPEVIELRCGATPIIQNHKLAGRALQRLGLEPYGEFYRKSI